MLRFAAEVDGNARSSLLPGSDAKGRIGVPRTQFSCDDEELRLGLSCPLGDLSDDIAGSLVAEGLLASRALTNARTRTPLALDGHPTLTNLQMFLDTAKATVSTLRKRLIQMTPGGLEVNSPQECLKHLLQSNDTYSTTASCTVVPLDTTKLK